MLDHLDLLSERMNSMGVTQQEVKKQITKTNLKVDLCTNEQRELAKQVKANGQAVAHLTLRQFDTEEAYLSEGSVLAEEEEVMFENVFAKGKKTAEPSKHFKQQKHHPRESLPHHTLPKMHFPSFDGSQPKIWVDKCLNYFSIYAIPEELWVEAATMHLQENAAKWWQAYKMTHTNVSWKQFIRDMQETFGIDDHRSALNDLLDLKQTATVEEYTSQFKSLQFDVSMHDGHYSPLFFATQYVRGLRDDIRAMVEPQVPATVETAAVIAKIQQKVADRQKHKFQNRNVQTKHPQVRTDNKPANHYGNLWRDKQLRDYRKANNLCYACGEKYEPGHAAICGQRNKPQINALAVNDLDREINEDLLNEMAIDEALTDTFG